MEKVLIVKLSSMGDLVQALPALSDAVAAYPGLNFDWVVDESFGEIPAWHHAVGEVFPLPLRRWKSESRMGPARGVLWQWRRDMKGRQYDAVVDLQGNFKSAGVTCGVKAQRHGYDGASIREWGAHLAYTKSHAVDKQQHAIQRMRKLMSSSLSYSLPETEADFGLDTIVWPEPTINLPAKPFLVFVANASWTTKSWPKESWKRLAQRAKELGYEVLLPWGSDAEHHQVQDIAAGASNISVLPRLGLTHIASIMERSVAAVCVDTGLAHISAAVGNPTVTLYGPTDPLLIGARGRASHYVEAGAYECIPCYRKLCRVENYKGPEARCLGDLPVESVWRALKGAIAKSKTKLNLVAG